MLRNRASWRGVRCGLGLLNEVLSLNAQEYVPVLASRAIPSVLNEVLSLNAQEFPLQR